MARAFRPQRTPERFGQLPLTRGVVFTCRHCGRAAAVDRDTALRTWGERGIIAEACRRLRCRNCKLRGMYASLTHISAKAGSRSELDKLVAAIRAFRPKGRIS